MTNMVNITNLTHSKQSIDAPRSSRFVVMLTEEEEQAIQNYRFANRIDTKAEAARRLIKDALSLHMKPSLDRDGGA